MKTQQIEIGSETIIRRKAGWGKDIFVYTREQDSNGIVNHLHSPLRTANCGSNPHGELFGT